MAETLIDSYSETNTDQYGGVSDPYVGDGQSFTCSVTGYYITSAKFYLYKNGSPTGNVYAKLYTHSGTYGTSSVGTGAALATSDPIDVSTLGSGVGNVALKTFTFSGANLYTMSNGTRYFISVEYTGGDGSNSVSSGHDNSASSHGGNRAYWEPVIPGWSAVSTQDVSFYVYGNNDPIASGAPWEMLMTGVGR